MKSKKRRQDAPEFSPKHFVVSAKERKLLRRWIRFFQKLSPRIKVFTPNEVTFAMFYIEAMRKLNIKWSLKDQNQMPNWIIPERVAFVLGINSALSHKLRDEPVWSSRKVYIFYFNDIAFNLQDYRSATTLSLEGKKAADFKWIRIQREIIEILDMLNETDDPIFS